MVTDVTAFRTQDLTPPATPDAEAVQALAELRVQDYTWRVNTRPIMAWIFLGLLLVQNALVVVAIFVAGQYRLIGSLTPFFIGITTGTLAETAAIVQIVVRLLFKEIDYRNAN
jgi:hypothetical protein